MKAGTVACLLLILLPHDGAADDERLQRLLAAVGRYVQDYEPQLSAMVAEEDYRQVVRRGRYREEQRTTSEFLFLKLPGALNWVGFRDVHSVDGEPVRQERDRLGRIVQRGGDVAQQAAALAAESAEYNLGPVVRTINVPTLMLGWLAPDVQGRFLFARKGDRSVGGSRCRVIEFSERVTPTLIRGRGDTDVRAFGSVCASDDGRIWATELEPEGRARVAVTYRLEPQYGMLVPAEMRERYGDDRIECVARYSRYRRFAVTTRIR